MKLCHLMLLAVFSLCSVSSVCAGTLIIASKGSDTDSYALPSITLGTGSDISIIPPITTSIDGSLSLSEYPLAGSLDLCGDPDLCSGTVVPEESEHNDIAQPITGIQATHDYDIFVDGDLYLDYSVFSSSEVLSVSGSTTIIASTVTIYSYDDVPIMPDLSQTIVYSNPVYTMSELGTILMFLDTPITNGTFEATRNLYVGNYASLQPVPLPPSAVMLLFGCSLLGGKAVFHNRFRKDGAKRLPVC